MSKAFEKVLECEGVSITPQTFPLYDYKDKVVKGDKYYVDKAISLGAKKPKSPKKKASE